MSRRARRVREIRIESAQGRQSFTSARMRPEVRRAARRSFVLASRAQR